MCLIAVVTGAYGALGKVMVSHLKKKGYQVIAISRTQGDYILDVCNTSQFVDLIKRVKPHLIMHFAVTFSNDLKKAYATNVHPANVLLDFIHKEKWSTRIVLIGSAAEYGVIHPEENPIHEQHLLNPISIYGLTKAWQTQLAILYAARGVDVVVARLFNLDASHLSEHLFMGHIQKQIAEVLAGKREQIKTGSLNAIRDYIGVDDAVDKMMTIVEHGKSGQVYHVASGHPVVMRDLLHAQLEKHHIDTAIVCESDNLNNSISHTIPVIYADISKTLKLVGSPYAFD